MLVLWLICLGRVLYFGFIVGIVNGFGVWFGFFFSVMCLFGVIIRVWLFLFSYCVFSWFRLVVLVFLMLVSEVWKQFGLLVNIVYLVSVLVLLLKLLMCLMSWMKLVWVLVLVCFSLVVVGFCLISWFSFLLMIFLILVGFWFCLIVVMIMKFEFSCEVDRFDVMLFISLFWCCRCWFRCEDLVLFSICVNNCS